MIARTLVLLVSLFFFAPLPRADVLVLVHGYLGSAGSWDESGVSQSLVADGWRYGGVVASNPAGLRPWMSNAPNTGAGNVDAKTLYAVDLPSTAPVRLQSGLLAAALDWLATMHPGEPFHLAGHSAGGVVARAALVEHSLPMVDSLITLASPHLGTMRAIEALDKTHESGPVGWVKDLFGGSTYHAVKDSWGLLNDLSPAYPGSYLYWLNGQSHPEFGCASVIRGGPVGIGDELVPAFSQDMNRVPALEGRCKTVPTAASHLLSAEDGRLIGELLKERGL